MEIQRVGQYSRIREDFEQRFIELGRILELGRNFDRHLESQGGFQSQGVFQANLKQWLGPSFAVPVCCALNKAMSGLGEQGADKRSRELKLYQSYHSTCRYQVANGDWEGWLAFIPCSSAEGAGGDALGCKLCMDRKLVPPSQVKEVRGNKGLAVIFIVRASGQR